MVKTLLLAIETASSCGSLALVEEGRCLAEYSLNSKLTHSRRLLVAIKELLVACDLDWPDLSAIAVSLGPGSFTGLRIGLSSAKGLCLAAAKPLIGVASLDGLACQLPHASLPICALLDARKGEVYTAFYRAGPDGFPARTSNYLALSPAKLSEMITEPTILLGDGLALYGDFLTEKLGDLVRKAPMECCFPRAAAIGLCALRLFRQGILADPAGAVPIYVRASDAELALGEKASA